MIKSSAHSSTFLAGNLTNRVFPLASYSCIRPSIKSFFCSPTMASTSKSTSGLCLKLLHMCCVLASFSLHPSCAAFPFDALHVDCFAILRLQIHRQLLVVAPCCCPLLLLLLLGCPLARPQAKRTAPSRVWLLRCTASVVAFKPQRSRMFGRNSLCSLAWRLWLWRFVADSFALRHFL